MSVCVLVRFLCFMLVYAVRLYVLPFVLAFSSRRSGVSGVGVFCVSVPCVVDCCGCESVLCVIGGMFSVSV